MHQVMLGGDPADLLLLVNVAQHAPHAAVNLQGDIVFLGGAASVCRIGQFAGNADDALGFEAWFRAKQVNQTADDVAPCGQTLEQMCWWCFARI